MWKVSKYGVLSGPYSVQIQENMEQKKFRIWLFLTGVVLKRSSKESFPSEAFYKTEEVKRKGSLLRIHFEKQLFADILQNMYS